MYAPVNYNLTRCLWTWISMYCNKPMIVCHQHQKRIISAELCAMSFDFYINHTVFIKKYIFKKTEDTHCLIIQIMSAWGCVNTK